ncbi:thiosulfate sulfurtransferase [Geobacter sp. OR-1]|uniref:sulfurtransferase n=1 Tax=Geobacter sp. OR-1 TaxID=1266765 RepID=UPI000541C869|nr:rhodanese-like domain-containing protein [Geobacter sp. OR-1]GAM08325.1 thiosulfate sulfurtransferase [Geobacter sp. OR-1]
MKKSGLLILILLVLCAIPVWGASLPAIVTTEWLEQNLTNPNLRIIDIRKLEEYKAGHVPGAVNAFYGSWAITVKPMDNQVPDLEDLQDVVRSAGIGENTMVVVVGKIDTIPDQVNAPRVAWTLQYAGIKQAAFLDGGMNKWVADKKPMATDMVKIAPTNISIKFQKNMMAYKTDVTAGKSLLVDSRLPEYYFGASKVPHVKRPGKIPGAVLLPSAWLFKKDGTLRDVPEIEAMAVGVVGKDKTKDMILYCDSGRLSAGFVYVLTNVLGYTNVRMYDDSLQDWVEDPKAPLAMYNWN